MFQVLLLSLLIITISWYFWRKYSPYLAFQSYLFINWEVIVAVLRGKGPHNKSLSVYLFQLLEELCKKHFAKGLVAIWIPEPLILIFGQDALKFFGNEQSLFDKEWPYNYFDVASKDGILRSSGKRAKRQRKLISPAFYPSMMGYYVTTMNDHAVYLVHELRQLENQTAKDIGEILKMRTMMLFCDAVLGIKMCSVEKDSRIDTFIKSMTRALDFVTYRVHRPWLHFDFMLNVSSEGRKHKKNVKALHSVAKKILEEMKESYDLRTRSKDHNAAVPYLRLECKKNFGEVLLEEQSKDPSFTDEDLESELITLIATGYESGSYALMWCLWLLGLHEDIQEKAYEEVKEISSEVISYEDSRNLTYLECIIKETLRLYPIVPFFTRVSQKDLYFEKFKFYAGTRIVFSLYAAHRHPELFPEPEVFNPDRFLEKGTCKKPSNFMPFAESVRSCIGKNYAMLEMKIFLGHVIRKFKMVSLTPREDVDVCWEILLKSSIPLSVKCIPR